MDVADFFPSVSAARVQAVFRTLGYPESVANLLGGLCTNTVSRSVWSASELNAVRSTKEEARVLYARSHLPQGAPTSPAIANLCAYRVDCRLSGLAQAAGAKYTRYADDLAFSGGKDLGKKVQPFLVRAAAILLEEGFAVNQPKTRIMRQSQRQILAGLVTNTSLNVPRSNFDELKATLTNCIRHGAATQNRLNHPYFRAHLEGRVAFVAMVSSAKGERLRELFDQIQW